MNTYLVPDSVRISYGTALKLNAWAIVAVFLSAFGHWYLSKGDSGPLTRGMISLLPLAPSFLYARAIAHWIRALDELQRRIQHEAWFFATAGAIFVLTALNLLQASGVLAGSRLAHGLGWEGTYAITFLLWVVGSVLSNRRYQ